MDRDIVIAIIGVIGSIIAAILSSSWIADFVVSKRIEEVAIYSAGLVGEDGRLVSSLGNQAESVRISQGVYRVTIRGLSEAPVPVASSVAQQVGKGNLRVDIAVVDANGFTLLGRNVQTNGPEDTSFSFLAVKAKKNPR